MPRRGPVVGIDLGTSYSCVAVVQDGQPVVIPNEWGEKNHASVVSFMRDGRVQVGNDAKKRILTNPRETVYSAKRLIGRFIFSPEVKKAQSVMPYQIVEGPNHGIRIRIFDKDYSVPQISAYVLKEMKEIAENYLGEPVERAVITVPAYFNDNQRQATADAGRIAGLEVLRIINEPTAAALAYGFGRQLHERVVVYDFGGGTFDVSILEIGNETFEVLATAGDTYLGGDDIDMRLMDYFADLFFRQTNINLRQDIQSLQKLREVAEETKKAFSQKKVVKVSIPEVYTSPKNKVYNFETTLDENTFNRMCADLIQRTFKVCDEALQTAGMSVHDIDGVILVGGPTRLPIIRDGVRNYFGKEPLTGVNPDEVVAIGAAIQAFSLVDAKAETFLLDVTPLSLRLATVGGFTEQIIARNTPVPIERTRTFTTSRDNQEKVRIRIMQGESNRADENELLGEFEFSGFRLAPRGEVKIEVTFEIDSNGIVKVSARDPETGQAASTTVNLSSGLTAEEIQKGAEEVGRAELV